MKRSPLSGENAGPLYCPSAPGHTLYAGRGGRGVDVGTGRERGLRQHLMAVPIILIQQAVLARDRHDAAPAAREERWGGRRIPIMQVVRNLLHIPGEFSGIKVQRNHAVGVQIIAAAGGIIEVRRGIAGRYEEQTTLRIDGHAGPGGAAALVGVAAPGRRRSITGSRHDVERPDHRPGRGIKRIDPAADAGIRTGIAGEHLAVECHRCAGDFVPLRAIGDTRVPQQLPARGVQRDQMPVGRTAKYPAPVQGHAPIAGRCSTSTGT